MSERVGPERDAAEVETGWPVRIVGQGLVDPQTLAPHPLNPKVHTPEQDAVVAASLRDVGWLRGLLLNRVTGHLLDGHERRELAIAKGARLVPVDYVEVAEADEAKVLLTLDPSGQLYKTHVERWAQLRAQTRSDEVALQAMWGKLAAQYGKRRQVDEETGAVAAWKGTWVEERAAHEARLAEETAALVAKWQVEAGQVWECGRHRVWCGDSLGVGVRHALLGGQRVDLVVTSPPYAVGKAYEGAPETGVATHRQLIRNVGAQCEAVVKPGGFVVVNFAEVWAQVQARAWTGRERACIYPMSGEYWQAWGVERAWELYAQRIWVKPYARLRQPLWTYHTSLAHQQEWEWVWTWRLPGGGGEAVYEWDVSSRAVWNSTGALDEGGSGPWDHWSAGFPQWLPGQVLRAHSAAGAVVWEPFLGGGTTLLACEALGRTCRGSDTDPGAIAVTLERWKSSNDAVPVRVT